ncbi:hypothetical protein ABT026_00685 [Streptomyces sp. NPDC002734]|uniref:hypothetical protein n=1 Tax=Streptomyces sp. NPDC002734 TaxID=3154426 RepID=UPI00331BFC13
MACHAEPAPDASGRLPFAQREVDLRDHVLSWTDGFDPAGDYSPPDAAARDRLARGVDLVLDNRLDEAAGPLGEAGFRVTRLTDSATGHKYDEIAAAGRGDAQHWGRLYLHAGAAPRWSVQVPHPVADRDTERLGVGLLESGRAGALVVAGSHRQAGSDGAADVAHREDSVFHTIVLQLQERGVPGLQLHGFASGGEGRRYDAVLSTGRGQRALPEMTGLADRLGAEGVRVCRGWAARCPLEGTGNVQGRAAQRQHVDFVHLELDRELRRPEGRHADEVRQALGELLSGWADA